jgi:CBS domain-containing protein
MANVMGTPKKDRAPATGTVRRGDLRDVAVATVMSHPVLAVPASASHEEALRVLLRHGVRHLAVLGADGTCVGLLTDRMLVAEWAGRPMAFHHRAVAGACDGQPTVPRDATLGAAAQVMRHCGTDAVIVVDHGRPIGVLTGGDVVALLAKRDPDKREDGRV